VRSRRCLFDIAGMHLMRSCGRAPPAAPDRVGLGHDGVIIDYNAEFRHDRDPLGSMQGLARLRLRSHRDRTRLRAIPEFWDGRARRRG